MIRFRRIRRARDDEGVALVLVVGSMLVLAMLAMTALAYTMSSQKFARYDQDYSGAMSAAQSGVDDFISRLNRDDGYYTDDRLHATWHCKGPTCPGNTCGWTADDAGRLAARRRRARPARRTPTSTTRSTRPRARHRGHDHA